MPVIIGIFIIGFLARAIALGVFLATDPYFTMDNDSHGYVSLAENLVAGNGFAWDTAMPWTPDSFRTPAYPLYLAGSLTVFGSFVPALIGQVFLSLLLGYLMLLIADRYLKIEVGIVAVAVFFLMPFSVLVTVRYLTQILFTTFLMLAVWFWLEYLSKGYGKYLTLSSLLTPLAALVRPIGIFLTAPFIASLALQALWKQVSWKKFLGVSAIMVAIFAVAIAPWVYRNYVVFGLPYLSSITAVQLYFYDAPAIYAESKDIGYEKARTYMNRHIEEVTGYNVAENPLLYTELSPLTETLKKEGLRFALADPMALIETRAEQFFKFFTRDGIRYWIEHYGIDTYSGWALIPIIAERAVLLLFTFGFFLYSFSMFMRKNITMTFMALTVLYFAALSGVMSSAGLRFPAEPLFLLLGTAGLFEVWKLIPKKKSV